MCLKHFSDSHFKATFPLNYIYTRGDLKVNFHGNYAIIFMNEIYNYTLSLKKIFMENYIEHIRNMKYYKYIQK